MLGARVLGNTSTESRARGALGLEHPTPMISAEWEAERGAGHLNPLVHHLFSLPTA